MIAGTDALISCTYLPQDPYPLPPPLADQAIADKDVSPATTTARSSAAQTPKHETAAAACHSRCAGLIANPLGKTQIHESLWGCGGR